MFYRLKCYNALLDLLNAQQALPFV